jgi:transposase
LARHRTQIAKKLKTTKLHIKSLLLFHGIKIPEEYDNSNWPNGFIAWLKKFKFTTVFRDLALQGKIRMFKFIKSEYLAIANQMRAYCRKEHKEITIY